MVQTGSGCVECFRTIPGMLRLPVRLPADALGKRGGILAGLDGLAAVCTGSGKLVETVELLATELMRKGIDESLTLQEGTMRRRAFERCQVALDPRRWEVGHRRGSTLDGERAVALARATVAALDVEHIA